MVEYMLRVSTGTAMMDSGGEDGRAWQRARYRDLKNEPKAIVNFKYGIEYSKSAYHHLVDTLEYDADEDQAYQRFARGKDDYDLALMAEYVERLEKKYGDLTGFYGDGKPDTVNTYDGTCVLDRTLQFQYWSYSFHSKLFLLLQVHGGCDVRGGYTAPVAFSCDVDEGFLDVAKGTIVCSHDGDHYWSTDDDYHWYREGTCGAGAGQQLEKYEVVRFEGAEVSSIWEQGKLFVDEDGAGYCPECGYKLEAST